MAQTQTRKSNQRKRGSSSSSRSKASAANKTSSTRSRSAASRNGRSTVESVKGTVTEGAQGAAETVAGAAKKARTGLLAGGAAVAGLGATLVVAQRARRRPKVLGISLPKRNGFNPRALNPRALVPKSRGNIRRDTRKIAGKVTEAADRAERFGQRVSSVASSVKQVSETADDAAKKA
jgi:hypothetical protein